MKAAETPRILWVELTSKCPLDCIFCSRKTRRGAGEHMPWELFESLIGQLSAPRTLLLNYSGESTVYPRLTSAIQLARSSGAFVELVSALVNVSDAALPELSSSGLGRLTVSLHSANPERYAAICRYGSFDALRNKLTRFVELCRQQPAAPIVDLAFVAMESNLGDLVDVATLAQSLGLRDISIFPVMRRDEIPIQFPAEFAAPSVYRPEFRESLKATLERAACQSPQVKFTLCDASFTSNGSALGEVPRPYPGPLPAGARIYSCEQNPWETAHVLSTGDIVACEVLDKIPLGNLYRQSMREIWHGEPYRAFRERYQRGEVPECRVCPWKSAYRPGPAASDIIASRGLSAQLLHGWHAPSGEAHIWASQQALAMIAPRANSRRLHVSGLLPPGPDHDPNELLIICNETEIGRVANPDPEGLRFGLDFAVPSTASPDDSPWFIEFRTRHMYRPSERTGGLDHRDLGFALYLLTSKAFVDDAAVERRKNALEALPRAISRIDAIGRRFPRRPVRIPRRIAPGLSVLIPERDNIAELADCLAGLREAAARWKEPFEIIIVVNGSPLSDYAGPQARYPEVRWLFDQRPLGFSGAVVQGLRAVRFAWVYLLNSDVVLDPEALAEAGRLREAGIFSIASQIVFKDSTRFREETNWTTLFIDDGLATIHDRIPESNQPVAGFYAGGGASLFQTRLLRQFARVSAYRPFYWEDAEWGWRARKLGYGSLFCPGSIAHHTQRSTIRKHYSAAEIDRVLERNRFLFQLRNFTSAGSLDRLCEELALSPNALHAYFLQPSTLWRIACGRWWNHRAPIPDDEVLDSAPAL